ncbi:hypothetical protein INR49_004236 [Caranx melampygus]|nr:hypothetical protein INR49_004236 [Caranx melampygus]
MGYCAQLLCAGENSEAANALKEDPNSSIHFSYFSRSAADTDLDTFFRADSKSSMVVGMCISSREMLRISSAGWMGPLSATDKHYQSNVKTSLNERYCSCKSTYGTGVLAAVCDQFRCGGSKTVYFIEGSTEVGHAAQSTAGTQRLHQSQVAVHADQHEEQNTADGLRVGNASVEKTELHLIIARLILTRHPPLRTQANFMNDCAPDCAQPLPFHSAYGLQSAAQRRGLL